MGPEEIMFFMAGGGAVGIAALVIASYISSREEAKEARRKKEDDAYRRAQQLYQLADLAGYKLSEIASHLGCIGGALDKIAAVTRVAAEAPPPPHQTEREIEEALQKAREWIDEATIGQSTKDLL